MRYAEPGTACALGLIRNEQDFVSSVSTLSTVRQGTVHLRRRIGEMDGQMGDVGRALGEQVRELGPRARNPAGSMGLVFRRNGRFSSNGPSLGTSTRPSIPFRPVCEC